MSLFPLVPTPVVSVAVSPSTDVFVGSNVNFTCLGKLSSSIGSTENISVSMVWLRQGVLFDMDNFDYITETETIKISDYEYQRMLHIQSTSSLQDTDIVFTCEVFLAATADSAQRPFILNSLTASETVSLSVHGTVHDISIKGIIIIVSLDKAVMSTCYPLL